MTPNEPRMTRLVSLGDGRFFDQNQVWTIKGIENGFDGKNILILDGYATDGKPLTIRILEEAYFRHVKIDEKH